GGSRSLKERGLRYSRSLFERKVSGRSIRTQPNMSYFCNEVCIPETRSHEMFLSHVDKTLYTPPVAPTDRTVRRSPRSSARLRSGQPGRGVGQSRLNLTV